ncbi:pentatricopeptide repeat-containing protein At1g69290 [Diospyros lotus]|uniref:pentatricopeptide repeat-containing protein At1g69290 n=1 Tax=Diospyros lotus TaxID=55363 RepID=UPI00225577A8|nr:pentatricopeptide repeat-containing protein At1g69290 [Diospyros lotus]
MWRRAASSYFLISSSCRRLSSEAEAQAPSLYSFLQPSLFALNRKPHPPKQEEEAPQTLTLNQHAALETALQKSLSAGNTDEAWKSFKALLSNASSSPSKPLANSIITHLSSLADAHNLKRAFVSVVFLLDKNPNLLDCKTLEALFDSMRVASAAAPAFALLKCMFKNRVFVPFGLWGDVLVEITRKNGSFLAFLRVFGENCRIALDENLHHMKPSLAACNAALEAACCELESVTDAESVMKMMSALDVRPDELSFGFLAYLYALKGLKEKIVELESLMSGFGFLNKRIFLSNLISGYVKYGSLESASMTILGNLRGDGEDSNFNEETFLGVVKGFLQKGSIKDLAKLIIDAQKLEPPSIVVEQSVGYGVIGACVTLGFLDKAHNILDEINARGCSIGLGVYLPILKAYCKEQRTAEATQLVMEISDSGLQLDVGTYDALIEASMSSQDFQSAFSLFRDMREARIPNLKGSYLTIMTCLTENHRPELMAAFLDEVVEDPRVKVGTHDWNSIIHAFCKAGRLEDARRTFRRMIFLQFEPNEQTYLSLINGYATAGKYFSVLMLWNEVKRRVSIDGEKQFKLDHNLVDAFLYALVKGGFFDAVMQVVEKSQEMKIFVDKWRYKQAFMENHKKLRVSKLRKRNSRKMEALVAFKNWAGLSA